MVVAIILIIATIATPSLLRSRQSANESASIGDLRALNAAEITYASTNGQNFASLANLASAGLIDSRFSTGIGSATLHGQKYVSEGATIIDPITSSTVGAALPGSYGIETNVAGSNARYDFETGVDAVIRYNTKFPAGSQADGPVK